MKRYPFIVKEIERWTDDGEFEGVVKGSIGRMEIAAKYVLDPSELEKYPVGTVDEVLLELEVEGNNIQIVEDDELFLDQSDGHHYNLQGKVIDINEHSILVRANVDMAIAIEEFPPITETGEEIELGQTIWAYGEMNIVFNPESLETPYWD